MSCRRVKCSRDEGVLPSRQRAPWRLSKGGSAGQVLLPQREQRGLLFTDSLDGPVTPSHVAVAGLGRLRSGSMEIVREVTGSNPVSPTPEPQQLQALSCVPT